MTTSVDVKPAKLSPVSQQNSPQDGIDDDGIIGMVKSITPASFLPIASNSPDGTPMPAGPGGIDSDEIMTVDQTVTPAIVDNSIAPGMIDGSSMPVPQLHLQSSVDEAVAQQI